MRFKRLLLATTLLTSAVASQPSGTGILAGKVVQRANGEPVRKAAVVLLWHSSAECCVALARTDSSGAFAFEALPPGRYTLQADREGFGNGAYGGESGVGRAPALAIPEFITLAEGERRTGLLIRISLPASISGVVLDGDGEPAQGAQVQAMMEAYPRGKRELVSVSSGSTNSRGEYRLGNLLPGKYYVVLQNAAIDPGDNAVFRRQFYGGAFDWKRAAPIALGSGEQARGIDFRAARARAVQLRGRVTGIAGDTPSEAQPGQSPFIDIRLFGISDDLASINKGAGAGPPEYRWEIHDILPGEYRMVASYREPGGRSLYARQFLEVGEQPSEIDIALAPAVDVKGTVRYEGDPALRPAEFRVELVSGENTAAEQPAAAKANADGTFTIAAVPPGIWDINPGPIPKGGFLKSMHLGKQDVLTEEMEITAATPPPLNIVISSRGGKVEGELEGDTARAKPRMVVLAPTGKFAGVMSFFAFAESDAEGKFDFSGLTPGAYRLFAFDQPPRGDFRGPEIVERMSRFGKLLEIREGETVRVSTGLMTPEQLKEALP